MTESFPTILDQKYMLQPEVTCMPIKEKRWIQIRIEEKSRLMVEETSQIRVGIKEKRWIRIRIEEITRIRINSKEKRCIPDPH
jgi:hypothetical protein